MKKNKISLPSPAENGVVAELLTDWELLFHRDEAAYQSYSNEDKYSAAMIARKAVPSDGEYEASGWTEYSVGPGL